MSETKVKITEFSRTETEVIMKTYKTLEDGRCVEKWFCRGDLIKEFVHNQCPFVVLDWSLESDD